MKKKRSGLKSTILKISVLPVFITVLFVLIFAYQTFSKGIYGEVENGLKSVAIVVANTYDTMYPGDYLLVGDLQLSLEKGGKTISGDYQLIDEIKKNTGVDITLFYGDARVLTTLTNQEGIRQIGTGAHAKIVSEVLEAQKEKFYQNVVINDLQYFAYYMPLFNSDGTCVGMIGVAKPGDAVMSTIVKTIYPLFLAGILGMILAGAIGIAIANNWLLTLNKIKTFLKEVAVGNLEAQMDLGVLNRKDEIGEMGRFTVTVQRSLQELVEFDNLTGLYNRRFGELKLKQLFEKSQKSGNTFCIAIGDVDFFKKYNETFGHECGDLVLKCVATIVKTHFGKKGFVARWGSEEFLIVIERCDLATAEEDLQGLLENIRNADLLYQGQPIKMTMTIGVSQGPGESSFHHLLVETEDKLYKGQLNGRNRVVK